MDLVPVGILLVLCSLSSTNGALVKSTPLIITQYINGSKLAEARSLSAVDPSLFLNVPSYAGYLTVNQTLSSNTFFWYFPVQGAPVETTPWIIWLQGGPGVSSLAGLFDEVGPFEYIDGTLKLRQYAWSKNYSMLFIDHPIGVGFSFTDKDEGYATKSSEYSSQLYSALQQFLTVFPELRKAPLFIAGESYAGRYVPGLAEKIMDAGQLIDPWTINLKGLIMGNPVLNREDIVNVTNAYYQWGLIDSQGAQAVKLLQDTYAAAVTKGNNELARKLRTALFDQLHDITMTSQTYNLLADDYDKLEDYVDYLKKGEVKAALHVGNRDYSFRSENVSSKLTPDFITDVNTIMGKLLNKYKVLIYCGHLDLTAPCVPNAEARRTRWRWNKRDDFMNASRVVLWHERTRAGYMKEGGGFQEALILGAGHLAAIDKPAEVFDLVSTFIKNIKMDPPGDYVGDLAAAVTTEVTTVKAPITTKLTSNVSTEMSKPDQSITTFKPEQNVTTAEPDKNITTAKPDKNITIVKLDQNITTVKPDQNITAVKPVQTLSADTITPKPMVAPTESSSTASAGTIVSIILNVVLILIVVLGVFVFYRLKKRNQDYFYNSVENNSDDIFLT